MMDATARRRVLFTPRGALLLFVLSGMLLLSVYPMRGWVAMRASVRELAAEERVLDQKIAALTHERDLLATDAEVERIARAELGMVRPGEKGFVIVEADRHAAVPPTARDDVDPEAQPSTGLFERWWRTVLSVSSALH